MDEDGNLARNVARTDMSSPGSVLCVLHFLLRTSNAIAFHKENQITTNIMRYVAIVVLRDSLDYSCIEAFKISVQSKDEERSWDGWTLCRT